jgi:hypothetical protein
MAALDLALGDFPEAAAQAKAANAGLAATLDARLCVLAPGAIDVTLANARAGHAWPSGATHDRRAWLEVEAFVGGTRVFASGTGDGPREPRGPDAAGDVGAGWVFGTALTDPAGAPTLFAWNAARADTVSLLPMAPGTTAHFTAPAAVDRVTARVRVKPVRAEITDALVASGDLAPEIAVRVPTFTLTTTDLVWTSDRGFACLP